jgi:hypothetical protein
LPRNDAIDLYYFGAAHTNGDAFVVFRSVRVMHAGDAFSDYGEFMKSLVGSVTASAKEGKTAEAALAAFAPAEKFKSYNVTRAKANVDVIYKELGK